MRFGLVLAHLRKKKKYSQDGLSRELGLSPCPLRSWESGRRLPTEDNFLKIVRILGRNEQLVDAYYRAKNSRKKANHSAFRNNNGESFGSRLRQLMTERELTVNSLAGYLKIGTSLVRKWLRDQGLPSAAYFDKLLAWVGEDLTLVDLYVSTQKFQHSWSMLRNNQKWVEKTVLPRSAFCERLKMERLKKNLTQADVGHELGISHSAVSLWEAKGIIPDRPKFTQLAALLELPQEMIDEYERLKSKRFRRKI